MHWRMDLLCACSSFGKAVLRTPKRHLVGTPAHEEHAGEEGASKNDGKHEGPYVPVCSTQMELKDEEASPSLAAGQYDHQGAMVSSRRNGPCVRLRALSCRCSACLPPLPFELAKAASACTSGCGISVARLCALTLEEATRTSRDAGTSIASVAAALPLPLTFFP